MTPIQYYALVPRVATRNSKPAIRTVALASCWRGSLRESNNSKDRQPGMGKGSFGTLFHLTAAAPVVDTPALF